MEQEQNPRKDTGKDSKKSGKRRLAELEIIKNEKYSQMESYGRTEQELSAKSKPLELKRLLMNVYTSQQIGDVAAAGGQYPPIWMERGGQYRNKSMHNIIGEGANSRQLSVFQKMCDNNSKMPKLAAPLLALVTQRGGPKKFQFDYSGTKNAYIHYPKQETGLVNIMFGKDHKSGFTINGFVDSKFAPPNKRLSRKVPISFWTKSGIVTLKLCLDLDSMYPYTTKDEQEPGWEQILYDLISHNVNNSGDGGAICGNATRESVFFVVDNLQAVSSELKLEDPMTSAAKLQQNSFFDIAQVNPYNYAKNIVQHYGCYKSIILQAEAEKTLTTKVKSGATLRNMFSLSGFTMNVDYRFSGRTRDTIVPKTMVFYVYLIFIYLIETGKGDIKLVREFVKHKNPKVDIKKLELNTLIKIMMMVNVLSNILSQIYRGSLCNVGYDVFKKFGLGDDDLLRIYTLRVSIQGIVPHAFNLMEAVPYQEEIDALKKLIATLTYIPGTITADMEKIKQAREQKFEYITEKIYKARAKMMGVTVDELKKQVQNKKGAQQHQSDKKDYLEQEIDKLAADIRSLELGSEECFTPDFFIIRGTLGSILGLFGFAGTSLGRAQKLNTQYFFEELNFLFRMPLYFVLPPKYCVLIQKSDNPVPAEQLDRLQTDAYLKSAMGALYLPQPQVEATKAMMGTKFARIYDDLIASNYGQIVKKRAKIELTETQQQWMQAFGLAMQSIEYFLRNENDIGENLLKGIWMNLKQQMIDILEYTDQVPPEGMSNDQAKDFVKQVIINSNDAKSILQLYVITIHGLIHKPDHLLFFYKQYWQLPEQEKANSIQKMLELVVSAGSAVLLQTMITIDNNKSEDENKQAQMVAAQMPAAQNINANAQMVAAQIPAAQNVNAF